MNKRTKAFGYMGAVSVFQILLNIVRNKFTALILGTYGIGIISVVNNILGLGQTASNLGINTGIVKKISDDTSNNTEIGEVISTAYIINLFSSVITLVLFILFCRQISIKNLHNEKYYIFFIIIAFSIPISAFNSIDSAIINGYREIKVITRISILSNAINVIVSILFIYFYSLNGAIYSILVMSIVSYVITFTALNAVLRKNKIQFKISLSKVKINISKTLLAFGATSIFALLFSYTSMILINLGITKKLGINYNGIFQADWSIMNQYIGIIFSSCGIYYFPTLCSLNSNEKKITEINKTLEMLLLLIVPMFIGILLFKDLIIRILYSNKFWLSADLLSVFIIGDYFKVIAWTLGFSFAPINRLKEFIVIDFFSNIFFTGTALLLLSKTGSLYGIAYSYIILNILICIVYYVSLNRFIGFKFKKYTKKNMLISFITLTSGYIAIEFLNFNFTIKFLILFIIFMVWFKIAIGNEKLVKLKSYFYNKLIN